MALTHVVAAAAVPAGDVEVAVEGPEADPSSVVVRLRLPEAHDPGRRARVGEVGDGEGEAAGELRLSAQGWLFADSVAAEVVAARQ